jgi:Na+-driven multidrug efflux pump
LRGYKRATVPLVINALGMWLVGLAGGYAIALTNIVERLPFGLVPPLGARGFWIGAILGMSIATLGIIAYFLAVGARQVARARTGVEAPRRAAGSTS